MTTRQKSAIHKLVENGGNVSKAMRDSGYSKNTARTPSKLTQSNAYIDLLNEKLPDYYLLNALRDDIDANPGNRRAYLELAFKLKGLNGSSSADNEAQRNIERYNEVVAQGRAKYGL